MCMYFIPCIAVLEKNVIKFVDRFDGGMNSKILLNNIDISHLNYHIVGNFCGVQNFAGVVLSMKSY